MSKELKALLEAKQTTRVQLDKCIAEKGQGILYLLDLDQIYNGVYLNIEDGKLKDPDGGYKGDLNTLEDVEAYYNVRGL